MRMHMHASQFWSGKDVFMKGFILLKDLLEWALSLSFFLDHDAYSCHFLVTFRTLIVKPSNTTSTSDEVLIDVERYETFPSLTEGNACGTNSSSYGAPPPDDMIYIGDVEDPCGCGVTRKDAQSYGRRYDFGFTFARFYQICNFATSMPIATWIWRQWRNWMAKMLFCALHSSTQKIWVFVVSPPFHRPLFRGILELDKSARRQMALFFFCYDFSKNVIMQLSPDKQAEGWLSHIPNMNKPTTKDVVPESYYWRFRTEGTRAGTRWKRTTVSHLRPQQGWLDRNKIQSGFVALCQS